MVARWQVGPGQTPPPQQHAAAVAPAAPRLQGSRPPRAHPGTQRSTGCSTPHHDGLHTEVCVYVYV